MIGERNRRFRIGLYAVILIFLVMMIIIVLHKHDLKRLEIVRRSIPYPERNIILTKIVHIISRAASISGTKPFLIYGSLLGYIRNKDFICYDFDVDMGVLSCDYDSLHNAIVGIIGEYPGFTIKYLSFMGKRKFIIYHPATKLNGDIYEFIKTKKGYKRNASDLYSKYILHERQLRYPFDWIDNLQLVFFKDVPIYIPNQSDKLLSAYYGDDFIEPDHVCNAECNECKKI